MEVDDEPPNAFLARLGKELKASEGVDADLSEIVSKHFLNATPADGCVEHALAAITALASERTKPRKEDADG